jgi:polar amino acid transport system substrate-binding protein
MVILTLLFHLGTSGQALSVDFKVLTEFQPQSATAPNNNFVGRNLDVVWEIMRRVGNTPSIETLPWARAYEIALHTPNVALVSTTRTQERDPLFHWVGPVLRLQWNFVARKDSDISINSLDDARKVKAIGTYLNDARDSFLMEQGFTNLDRCIDNETNYRKLVYGRVDLIVGTNINQAEAAELSGVNPEDLKVVYTIKEMDIYLAISKGSDPETVKAWQTAFSTMQEDGTFVRIFKRWFPNLEPPMDVRRPWLEVQ